MNKFFGKDHASINSNDKKYNDSQGGEIKVIGAGLPRTGTLSLKTALTQLYSGKCYHMMDVFAGDQEDTEVWVKASRGEMKPEDWRQFFFKKKYITGVDFPFSLFWKDIMAAYPDAKVVLSTRNPATWYESVSNSIGQIPKLMKSHPTIPFMLSFFDSRKPNAMDMQAVIKHVAPDGCKVSFEGAIEGGPVVSEQFFLDWEAEVKRVVPKDKLLVHSAKEGWGPLCQFLGAPVPENDYPRVNDTASIKRMIRNLWIVNGLIFYVFPLSLATASYIYQDELVGLLETGVQVLAGLKQNIMDKFI